MGGGPLRQPTMTAYAIALLTHSYLRWAIIVAALLLVLRSADGWRSARAWSPRDERLHTTVVGLADLQFLLGLALYLWLSPISRAFFAAPKPAMHDSVLRFFGLEHAVGMLAALAALHIGRKRSTRAPTGVLRQRYVCSSTLLFLVLAGVSIPWPGSRHGRPLLRMPRSVATERSAGLPCPEVFVSRCASCHGERGRGDGVAGQYLHPRPRDFADPSFLLRSDTQIIAIIREGGAAHGLSATMPPHADLSVTELQQLSECLKGLGHAAER
jgi:hypothetical protein